MLPRNFFPTQKLHAMLNRVKVKVIQRVECTNKQGSAPLSLQCFVNSNRVVIPLQIGLELKYYDKNKEVVKSSHPLALQYNKIIRTAIERAATVQAEANSRNQFLDSQTFRNHFLNLISDYDFVAFCEKEINKRYYNKEIAKGTWEQQKSSIKKFREFKNSIPISMMNTSVLVDYEAFLRKRKNNSINTIGTAMKNIKTYINRLDIYEIEVKSPFKKYQIKTAQTQRSYLEVEELMKLVSAYVENRLQERLRGSLLFFLFSCFTSLRISDTASFKDELNRILQNDCIVLKPKKTINKNKQVIIPLHHLSRYFIKEIIKYSGKLKYDVNSELKMIAAYSGIDKNISFKTARHTFATVFLILGGKVEVLQQILCHSDISTTMIYVHIVDRSGKEQMANFDKLLDGTLIDKIKTDGTN